MQRKGPLPGKIFARCILQRRFAGHFGCMARISCQSQLISDAWRANLATKPPLFSSEATFGMHGAQNLSRSDARERTAAESCHGKALGNASRENIATASQAKSASGRNPATVERRGNAFRGHFAIGECPGTHRGTILPSPGARKHINEELA